MFLSQLEFNPRSREAQRDLARPYELHRTLALAFGTPDGQDYRAAHGVLFRLEFSARGVPVVLVQSLTKPNWSALPANYLGSPARSKPVASTISAGQVLGFRLVAQPTKKVTAPGQRQGKRVALLDTGPDDAPTPARQWLHRQGTRYGFELLHTLSEEIPSYGNKASTESAKNQLQLYGVRFDGLLRVHDPTLVGAAIQQGIGPGKAFGFGLLSVAPAASY